MTENATRRSTIRHISGGTMEWLRSYKATPVMGPHAYYLLIGDLNQMGIMERTLKDAGFPVVRSQSGTYPGFLKQDKDEFVKALRYLFEHRVEGWWGQDIVKHGICTDAEFKSALSE